ncbi:hypothetical protein OOT46_04710 [Aquabacterium sp. A7-Y]|uniref:hypothetical protein n=1 Tax=Aquabacterium sp. A7-Y TaxID=1349605 RepID=UPI00223CECEA|nr:hypothetical protein [Aquabacterium sp. A7-Y]MCW7537152.1 hypothetical protein [Aquabacterium sp. A7-Y]
MKCAMFLRLAAGGAALVLAGTARAEDGLLSVRIEGPGLNISRTLPLGDHGRAAAMRPAMLKNGRLDPGDHSLTSFSRLSLADWSLLGDYYFRRSLGLRATGGLLKADKARPMLADDTAPVAASLGSSSARSTPTLGLDSRSTALPYLGMGYSELAAAGGWGFFADVGVVMLKPKSTVKLGSSSGGAWFTHEETRREGEVDLPRLLGDWRLSPLVQVGLSYSF